VAKSHLFVLLWLLYSLKWPPILKGVLACVLIKLQCQWFFNMFFWAFFNHPDLFRKLYIAKPFLLSVINATGSVSQKYHCNNQSISNFYCWKLCGNFITKIHISISFSLYFPSNNPAITTCNAYGFLKYQLVIYNRSCASHAGITGFYR